MAEQFTPDEKIRKIIKDIMKHPPVSFEDMKKAEAEGICFDTLVYGNTYRYDCACMLYCGWLYDC